MSNQIGFNKVLFFFLLVSSVMLLTGCGADDDVEPDPVVPENVFRVTSYQTIEDTEVLETTTVHYDNENRVDYVLTKEADQVIDSMHCVYNSSTQTTCTFYNPNNNLATRIINIQFDEAGRMISNAITNFDATPLPIWTQTQVFDYSNNVLTDYLYQIDFEGDGIFDRTNDGQINWDGDQIQSIVTHTFSNSINYIDSTLYEYEGDLISITRNLNSSNGGDYELVRQSTPMYENNLITSAFIQEFFTDENGFTFPVSEGNVDFFEYNENELLEKEFSGDTHIQYSYEDGTGNFGPHYFSCIGETTHLCVLGVLPTVE